MPFGDKTLPSNMTGTFFALETVFNEVPDAAGTQWYPIEPNEYGDFGSEIEKEARAPITADRQNRKAVVINETAQAGYTHDMVQETMENLWPGFMFDDWLEPAAGSKITAPTGDLGLDTVDVPNSIATMTSDGATDFTTWGLIAGQWLYIGGDDPFSMFDNKPGWFRVKTVDSATVITFDRFPDGIDVDPGLTNDIQVFFPRTLRTQPDPALIKRHSYTFHRVLEEGLQYERVTGCVANTLALTIPTTGKLTAEVGVAGAKTTYAATASQGIYNDIPEEEAYSAAMPGVEMRLIYATGADAFTFVSEATINIDNQATPVNAVGYLGAIDMSAGNFMGTAEVTAYFTEYAAIEAIRNNDSVGLFLAMAANNKGWVIDMPYVTLGGGMLQIEANEPIRIPLTVEGAKDPVVGHTMIVCQFQELPAVAGT